MPGKRLTGEDKDRIKILRAEGQTLAQIVKDTGFSIATVDRYVNPNGYAATKDSTGYNMQWRKSNPEAFLLQKLKQAAERKGVLFTLTLETLPALTHNCPKCGVQYKTSKGWSDDTSRSLDRITPALGYVPGNVMWLCCRCNRQKDNMDLDDFRSWVKFLEEMSA